MVAADLHLLAKQAHPGEAGVLRRRAYVWMEGLGVRLALSVRSGDVWGPEWLNRLEVYSELRSNALACAIARAARDAEWARSVTAAYALGGGRAVAAMVREEG